MLRFVLLSFILVLLRQTTELYLALRRLLGQFVRDGDGGHVIVSLQYTLAQF